MSTTIYEKSVDNSVNSICSNTTLDILESSIKSHFYEQRSKKSKKEIGISLIIISFLFFIGLYMKYYVSYVVRVSSVMYTFATILSYIFIICGGITFIIYMIDFAHDHYGFYGNSIENNPLYVTYKKLSKPIVLFLSMWLIRYFIMLDNDEYGLMWNKNEINNLLKTGSLLVGVFLAKSIVVAFLKYILYINHGKERIEENKKRMGLINDMIILSNTWSDIDKHKKLTKKIIQYFGGGKEFITRDDAYRFNTKMKIVNPSILNENINKLEEIKNNMGKDLDNMNDKDINNNLNYYKNKLEFENMVDVNNISNNFNNKEKLELENMNRLKNKMGIGLFKDMYRNTYENSGEEMIEQLFEYTGRKNEKIVEKKHFDVFYHSTLYEQKNLVISLMQTAKMLKKFDFILTILSMPLLVGIVLNGISKGESSAATSIGIVATGMLSGGYVFNSIIKNFLDSILFVFFVRPFEIEDFVRINNVVYRVAEINVFTSVLMSNKLNITFLNHNLLNTPITNFRKSSAIESTHDFTFKTSDFKQKHHEFLEDLIKYMRTKFMIFKDKAYFKDTRIMSPDKISTTLVCELNLLEMNINEFIKHQEDLVLVIDDILKSKNLIPFS